jgi:hypothetical protein
MTEPHFEKDRYLVIKREYAEKMLSAEAMTELENAVREIGYTYFVVNLDEPEGRSSMDTYFSSKFGEGPDRCPECGSFLVHQGGCVECSNSSCGWSACS